MTKWADYLISAVRYNNARTHIDKVKVHEDNVDTVGPASEWTRKSAVEKIDKGFSIKTIVTSNDGKWKPGEDVRTIVIDNEKFLRTDMNQTKKDNLGSLPEF